LADADHHGKAGIEAHGRTLDSAAIDVLFLCTGNICRSPMAEAMLAYRLAQLGVDARVTSAGLLDNDMVPPYEALAVLADMGLDTSGHRSRRMTVAMLEAADVVIGMARRHVHEAITLAPSVWPKTFTLKELVRRGGWVGPREPGQPFDEWLAKIHAGRTRSDLIGSSSDDDVPDPIGLSRRVYERTAMEIDGLIAGLMDLGWGLQ
jgi:protein-tyrosine phosphatase